LLLDHSFDGINHDSRTLKLNVMTAILATTKMAVPRLRREPIFPEVVRESSAKSI
jgi:hypothetical protein